jgi:hypothetical protein
MQLLNAWAAGVATISTFIAIQIDEHGSAVPLAWTASDPTPGTTVRLIELVAQAGVANANHTHGQAISRKSHLHIAVSSL